SAELRILEMPSWRDVVKLVCVLFDVLEAKACRQLVAKLCAVPVTILLIQSRATTSAATRSGIEPSGITTPFLREFLASRRERARIGERTYSGHAFIPFDNCGEGTVSGAKRQA